jgi:DnaJ-domain-containing protein 1
MSDDSYYSVLDISENATQYEIKQAYRDLIRQVHPDRVPNASAYWRRTAEERSKAINEAYHVLADPDQRASYNEQLAKYLRRPVPAPASPLTVRVTPARSYHRARYSGRPQSKTKRLGYNWQPLRLWAAKYPLLACSLCVLALLPVASVFTRPRQNKPAIATDNMASFEGFYTAFPCLDPRETVSPIDGKPCRKADGTTLASEVVDANPRVKRTNIPAQPAPSQNSPLANLCGEDRTADGGHKPCKFANPKWFYIASDGIHPLGSGPDKDTCKHINPGNLSACRARLKVCPRGVWAQDCVSYSKWKKNADPARQEKWIPAWPPL